jgi:ribosomal protein S18 acetylase RimI-like enzyme
MISLRAATEQDIDFLLDLRLETMGEHFIAAGINQTNDYHRQRVLIRFECARIVLYQNQPIGLFKFTQDELDWDIIQIQIKPAFQGKGIGGRLLEQVIAEAQKAGASLKLSVFKKNPARHLYERFGFAIVAETDDAFEMLRVCSATT